MEADSLDCMKIAGRLSDPFSRLPQSVVVCRILEGKDAAAADIDRELLRKRTAEELTGAWDTCLACWKSLPKHKHTAGAYVLTPSRPDVIT